VTGLSFSDYTKCKVLSAESSNRKFLGQAGPCEL
jgi:hypothetical protein